MATSLRKVIDITHTYWSWVDQERHTAQMDRSVASAAAVLGEVEAAASESEAFAPLATAQRIALAIVMADLVSALQKRHGTPRVDLKFVGPILTQMLAALASDDAALSAVIRCEKTRSLGPRRAIDDADVPAYRRYIWHIVRQADQIHAAIETWDMAASVAVDPPELAREADDR